MKIKKFLSEITFWLHLPIVIILFGTFFLPKFVWAGKVTFHFWYVLSILAIEFLWGLVYLPITRKIDIICPLTTLTEYFRGVPFKSKKNYGHSFIAELLERMRLNVSYIAIDFVMVLTLVIVIIQFIWFN